MPTQVKGQEIISQEVMAFMGRASNSIKVRDMRDICEYVSDGLVTGEQPPPSANDQLHVLLPEGTASQAQWSNVLPKGRGRPGSHRP